MEALAFYGSIAVVLVSASAASLCFAYLGAFRHRSALWLSFCMVGITSFALAGLAFALVRFSAANASLVGPVGVRLLLQAFGALCIVHGLPRLLLAAFGAAPRRLWLRLLDAMTFIVAALAAVRVATGWVDLGSAAPLPNGVLRVLLYAFIGGAFACTMLFQSRLPDRSLYRIVIVQIAASAALVPFVILEDLGLFAIPGFPYLSGQLLLVATALFGALHAQRSMRRPKYVDEGAPSSYFAEHFGMSERELEVATGVMSGLSNGAIAEKLFISPRTVEKHLSNIYQKAGIKNRVQLYNLFRSDLR